MISPEKVNQIKKKLEEYGDGSFEFETRDIEELLISFEESQKQVKRFTCFTSDIYNILNRRKGVK